MIIMVSDTTNLATLIDRIDQEKGFGFITCTVYNVDLPTKIIL